MGFWGSLFGGSSPTLNKDIDATGQIAGFASGLGQSNLSKASKFWSDIMGGDSSKQMQALAPEISSLKTSAQQGNKTAAEFGTRSGGTAASTAATNDKVHSDITNLIGSLTGSSAQNLANTGGNLLSTGLEAYGEQAKLDDMRVQNWANSILGKGITSGVSSAESAGLGAAGI